LRGPRFVTPEPAQDGGGDGVGEVSQPQPCAPCHRPQPGPAGQRFGELAGASGAATELAQDTPVLELGVGAFAGSAESGVGAVGVLKRTNPQVAEDQHAR
jgi:hypothetical protein